MSYGSVVVDYLEKTSRHVVRISFNFSGLISSTVPRQRLPGRGHISSGCVQHVRSFHLQYTREQACIAVSAWIRQPCTTDHGTLVIRDEAFRTFNPDAGAPLGNPENIALFNDETLAGRCLPDEPCRTAASSDVVKKKQKYAQTRGYLVVSLTTQHYKYR